MQTGATQKQESGENIDLLLLAERSILFFRKYRWVFIIATGLGLLSGYLFYRAVPNTYRSRMVLHSFLLTNAEEIQVVKNWNELLNKKEHPALASALGCPVSLLGKVKKISASEIQQVFSQVNPNGFVINVLVTDTAVLDELQQAIVYGFEHMPYVEERLSVKKENLRELIEKTGEEIIKLDSTRKIMEGIIGGKGSSGASLIVDGSSVNRQLIEMNEKLLSFKEGLQFTKAVQVLQDFGKFGKPDGPRLLPWLAIGLLFFLGLAYGYALFSSINQGLKKRAGRV